MPPPLAYFLTWTCKGTWLHGDERRSVDKAHNKPGEPRIDPNMERETLARIHLDKIPFELSGEARAIVGRTIKDHCTHRSWELIAINVRTNHVHVVVDCGDTCAPEKAMGEFKSWSTRRLRDAGKIRESERPWTSHGSTRWINTRFSLEKAIEYVNEMQ